MPIEIWDGSQYIEIEPVNAQTILGPNELQHVTTWDGSAWRTIWELETLIVYLENFPIDRTDGWGPDWTTLGGTTTPRIQSGVAVMGPISSGSGGWCQGRYDPRPGTDDVKATVKVVKPPSQSQANDNELIIGLRGTELFQATGASGVWFVMYPGSCSIITNIDNVQTARASGGAVAVNSEIECIAMADYYALRNKTTDVTLCEWVDVDGAYAYEGNRYMHMYQEGNFPMFQSAYGSYGTDWIQYEDIEIPAPTITGFSPASWTTGGGLVAINGTNFFTKPIVKINGVEVSSSDVALIDKSTVWVTSPAIAAGNATVEVIFPYGSDSDVVTVIEDNRVNSGITKSGSYDIPTANVWAKVPGWVVHANYLDTDLANDTIVIQGTGLHDLSASVTSNYNAQIRIVKNGSQVLATSSLTFNPSIAAQEFLLNEGDTIELQALKDNVYVATIISAGQLLALKA